MWHSKLNKCDSGVVGNARPCQGRDRGFEPRLSLLFDEKGHPKRMSFFVERAPSGAQSSSVFVPLRSAQSRCPPDTLRRLSLLFNKKGTSGRDVPFSLKEPHPGLKVRASSFHCGRRRAGVHRTPCAVYRFYSMKKDIRKGCPFSSKEPHPGLKVRASSFHYGRRRAGVHRTPCAVYRFCSTKKGHPEGMSLFR